MWVNNHFTRLMDNNYCLVSAYVDSSRPNRPQPKQKKRSVVNDPPVRDDTPVYAQPNKRAKKAQTGTQAKGSKGKSPTGKGKKSRESWNINLK